MTRAVHARDAPRMAQIHEESFYKGWSAEEMASHIKKDLCLGHGRPLDGFVIISHSADQAEIVTIAIDLQMRRPAITFYKKSGFEPIGKRPAYYKREKGRVAALTFRKALSKIEGKL